MRIKYFLLFVLWTSLFFSCRKDFYENEALQYTLKIAYPEGYSSAFVSDAEVLFRNTITGTVFKLKTDESGEIKMSDLLPGIYNISVSRTLSPQEAELQIGNSVEVFLNGTLNNVKITANGSETLKLVGSATGDWLIKEYYYAGVPSFYFYDLFIEVYNNSADTLYADSLLIGNTKVNTASGSISGFIDSTDYVYLQHIWRVPGSGKEHMVLPGASIIISMDGINHQSDPLGNPNSPVNLGAGISDFETFWPYGNRDIDAVDVPNMIHEFASATAGFDWMPGSNGTGLVVFRDDNPSQLPAFIEPKTTSSNRFARVPVKQVIDGIDVVGTANVSADRKRLPSTIDAGLSSVNGIYNGKSLRRKVKTTIDNRKVLMDTNNSNVDFEVNSTPTPKSW